MHIIRFFLSPLHRKFKKQKTSHGRASILCTYYLNSSTEGWKKMKKKRILKINAVIFNFYETYQCIFYKKMFRHRAHNETTNNNSIGSSCHHMNRDNSAYESKKKVHFSRQQQCNVLTRQVFHFDQSTKIDWLHLYFLGSCLRVFLELGSGLLMLSLRMG